ncbi:MAG: Spx/MgsR family RNA polymerase-binding regulatory protein [Weeksellaceae bacterium]|nr:Spx/MgsR family RNA polymerase-binding regulatory protein [Weeksellaceae bacterium]
MKKYTVYGIPNCDSVRKTLKFLKNQKVDFEFVNYKNHPADLDLVKSFTEQVGWQPILNKRGTTWRKLSDDEKLELNSSESVEKFLSENNSAIKRPIVVSDLEIVAVGFDQEKFDAYHW